jgi:AraC family transcriptional regulator of arabinose operon
MDPRVSIVLEITRRKFDRPLLVRDLAARLRISPSRLEHLVKQEVGQSLKSYLRGVRMAKAGDMLNDPAIRIKEVAASVGYTDACNFSRDFKKHHGVPPSRIRDHAIADLTKK